VPRHADCPASHAKLRRCVHTELDVVNQEPETPASSYVKCVPDHGLMYGSCSRGSHHLSIYLGYCYIVTEIWRRCQDVTSYVYIRGTTK
jgi:hypothetical protein